MNDTATMPQRLRLLSEEEIALLESRGCSATDWNAVRITDRTDLRAIRNVDFVGDVTLGALGTREEGAPSSLRDVMLENCIVEDHATIRNVPGGIRNAVIGRDAVIENVARIEFEPEAPCGIGVHVSVLDETGSRPVAIYPGLSAQLAMLMARMPRWAEHHLLPHLSETFSSSVTPPRIGEEAVVRDCGPLLNVAVGREVRVEGAARLANGSIINNAAHGRPLARVGNGVDAENFIIEDGIVDAGALLRNCYVGQGAVVEKRFTAHDSLFFANTSLENGEACALFAGPYTVSMHKGTLLIGCQTSFMNAGSSTNQSNHMYKLGPVHWGVLERGVKTSSNSYLMLGAHIGAFSLLMGSHKTHPDSRQFPFSYLFGDERGATVVVPAQMLRSCGLLRDEKKWPTRDRRLKSRLPICDRVIFDVLNPFTVNRMLEALPIIDSLLDREADDDRFVRYRGMKFSRASLERAKYLYTLTIFKYLNGKLPDGHFPAPAEKAPEEWIDLAGQILPRPVLDKVMESDHPEEMEQLLTDAYENYAQLEMEWIAARFDGWWREREDRIAEFAAEFDKQVEQDRTDYLDTLSAETQMLAL